MDSKSQIREFLAQLLAQKKDPRPFDDKASLLLTGRLDSIDTVEVILFLESRFGVDFNRRGFQRSQLDSVNKIDALVTAAIASKT